jgi:hypothetical protein
VSIRLFQKIHPKFPPVVNFHPNFWTNFWMAEWLQACGVELFLVQACSREEVVQSAHREQSTPVHIQGRSELAETAVFAAGE